MSTVVVFVVIIVAAVFAGLPSSNGFQWTKDPGQVIKMTYPDQRSLTLRWEWKLSNNEELWWASIKQYKTNYKNNASRNIATCYKSGSNWTYSSFYDLSCKVGKAGVTNGFIELTIKDVTKQDYSFYFRPSDINVMAFNYSFECEMLLYPGKNPTPKVTDVIVYMRPTIKRIPENKYVDSLYKDVTLNCTAEGNPKPTITWEHKHPSGVVRYFKGEELIISGPWYRDPFQLSDIGIYTCIATNNVGTASATAVVHYTECGSGCFTDDKISIEMTQLAYTSDYDYSSSTQYTKIKHAVEVDCLNQYCKAAQNLFSCVVTGFRKGSVIADIKITYPNPRKPLQTAIETGKFAGQRVKTSFIQNKGSTSMPTSTVIIIVLGVLLGLSLVVNLIFIIYSICKQNKGRNEGQARSLNSTNDNFN